jgi:hypothetical protein
LDGGLGTDNSDLPISGTFNRPPHTRVNNPNYRDRQPVAQSREGDRGRCVARHNHQFEVFSRRNPAFSNEYRRTVSTDLTP